MNGKITISTTKEIAKAVKMIALQRDITTSELIVNLISEHLLKDTNVLVEDNIVEDNIVPSVKKSFPLTKKQ